jgi:hypothetical protein
VCLGFPAAVPSAADVGHPLATGLPATGRRLPTKIWRDTMSTISTIDTEMLTIHDSIASICATSHIDRAVEWCLHLASSVLVLEDGVVILD